MVKLMFPTLILYCIGRMKTSVTPRPSKGTTITIHGLTPKPGYTPDNKRDSMTSIKLFVQSMALVYFASTSITLKDERTGQIVVNTGRTKGLQGICIMIMILPLLCTLKEENFHWYLIFATSLMANSLNLNSVYSYIYRNISVITLIIEIQINKIGHLLI